MLNHVNTKLDIHICGPTSVTSVSKAWDIGSMPGAIWIDGACEDLEPFANYR